MRVAITGGTGFLGDYVVEHLISKGHIPVILTRSKESIKKGNVDSKITSYDKCDLIGKLKGIDGVIHLAATRGSQGMISEFHDNEVLTQNLYDACYELGIKNIVYASTISIYSSQKELPWKENQLPLPKLMYGVSKLTCEHIGNIYSLKKGMNVKNLRLAHLYGFNEKNNYMINKFFRQAFHKKELNLHGKSIAKREFLYAKDAAIAIICALEKQDLSGTYNIGSEEAFTNYEVAFHINEVFCNTGNLSIKDPKASEGIEPSFMDSSLSKKELGYVPNYTFTTAIGEIYSLMKELDDVPLLY
ncbi:SDR family oxidoreductase [Priestia flexa]|nr:SDR family oxidoreductase [Priestia flexa]